MNAFAAALKVGNFNVSGVCTDCFMVAVNGDASGNSEDWNASEYERIASEYDITPGHLHTGKWSEDCSHSGSKCEDDCDCTRIEYGRLPCGMCGTTLHGVREDMIFIRREVLGL